MTVISWFRQLLGDGSALGKCVTNANDINEYMAFRGDISEKSFGSYEEMSAIVGEEVFDEDAIGIADKESRDVLDQCCANLDDRDRDALASFIAGDLHLVATALEHSVNLPFVTALWLSYRAEELPTEPLEVDLPLKQVLNAGRAEARKLLDQARKSREGELAQRQTEHEAFGDRVAAAAKQLPDAQLLRELLLQQRKSALGWHYDVDTQLSTTVDELPAAVKLPATWRKLLRAQEKGEELAWKEIWGGFEKLMPAAFTFLDKHCCGLAVVTHPEHAPQLFYVYPFETDRYACGYSYSAYLAGPGVGARVPKKVRDAFDILPPQLQEFYSKAHDGWCQIEALEYGPLPLEHLHPLLATLDANNLPDIPVDMLWDVVRMLGGRASLCLDAATSNRKRPKAVFFNHPIEPPETGLDFWKEFKHWLAEGLEISEMVPKG